MKKTYLILLLAVLPVMAQRTIQYDRSLVSQVRIDLRDLGYPPVDVIPSDECAIRALTVAPSGAVYGITSGKRAHLFVLFPRHGYVKPLGVIPGVSTVYRALVVAQDGSVIFGSGSPDGHLYQDTPKGDESKPIRVDAPLEVKDLGVPVAGEGVFALAINRMFQVIYGVTTPNGHFFSYDIKQARFTVHGKVAERKMPGEKFENEKSIGRELVLDAEGNVYASGENGTIYQCSLSGRLVALPKAVLTVPGREPYVRVDAWTVVDSGAIYGGSSDGYLFRLDPKTGNTQNLGKPLNQYRIRGLVAAPGGKLYGVGGDDDEMARLFSYDPATGVYELLGMLEVNRRPYYAWQAYVIDAMAIGLDGTIYMGQSERRSKLYLYYPER